VGLTVSGFVSGLDVTTIVSQLMQSESQTQTNLKTQLSGVQSDASAYRDVNSKFAALLTAAQALGTASFGSAVKATATDSSVTAAAVAGATTGSSITFSVTSLASAQSVMSNATWTSPTEAAADHGPGWPLTVLDANGKSLGQITLPSGGTLSDAAAAINASGYGLTATVVQTDTNAYRLQVASTATGTAHAFTLQGANETAATAGTAFTGLSSPTDAVLDLGGGVSAKSSSNTFSSLLNGVSVTVTGKTSSPVTVSVGTDTSAITKQVQALVDAANATLTDVASTTSTSTTAPGVLAGDYSVQSLGQQLLQAVASAVGTSGSAARIGLQLTDDGKLTFDSSKFSSALAATPDLVQKLVAGSSSAPGFATRLATLAKSATDSVTGTLVTLANGEDSRAKDLQAQIDDWTVRLTARQDALTTLYSNLQSTLSGLQSQSSWLSSMFTSSSTSKSS
jgi:flagellar hook-associated protein 2